MTDDNFEVPAAPVTDEDFAKLPVFDLQGFLSAQREEEQAQFAAKQEQINRIASVAEQFIEDLRAERRLYPDTYALDLAKKIAEVL